MEPWLLQFEAIGTRWTIRIDNALDTAQQANIAAAVRDRIAAFDKTYSRFREDSLVAAMADKAGRYVIPDDTLPLLGIYKKLYELTDGQVTPLIGQVMVDAGYDPRYSLRPKPLQAPPSWDDAFTYDDHYITMHRPALLDFGAAGKGYLIDIIGELLTTHGVTEYLINAGGDIVQFTQQSTTSKVALENPLETSEAIGIAHITNQSLCASAGSRRKWGEFHHIISPKTLASPRHIVGAWVVAKTALVADGLATALYFTDPLALRHHFQFEYAILDDAMALHYSNDFPAEFFEAAA